MTEEAEEEQDDDRSIIVFKKPVPPCRVPVRQPDGSLVVDFPSEAARAAFKQRCTKIVARNCEAGARGQCSLRAMDQCRGPGWLRWLGWSPRKTWSEMEACEEQAMEACVVSSQQACQVHAEQFCEAVTRPPSGS